MCAYAAARATLRHGTQGGARALRSQSALQTPLLLGEALFKHALLLLNHALLLFERSDRRVGRLRIEQHAAALLHELRLDRLLVMRNSAKLLAQHLHAANEELWVSCRSATAHKT